MVLEALSLALLGLGFRGLGEVLEDRAKMFEPSATRKQSGVVARARGVHVATLWGRYFYLLCGGISLEELGGMR